MTINSLPSPTLVPTCVGTLALRQIGARTGPVTVLWHSMFVDSSSWNRVIPLLPRDRRLLIVDGPGYGDSGPLHRTSSIAECACAAIELLDSVGISDPVDWVGNAWGGHVGYHLAGTSPDRLRTLVTISAPALPLPRLDRIKLEGLSYVLRLFGPTASLRRKIAVAQLTDGARQDPEMLEYMESAVHRAGGNNLAHATRSFIVRRSDLSEHAANATLPILIVATDDRGELTPEQARATAVKCCDAEVAVVGKSRTLVPLEQPQQLADLLIDFWARRSRQ
ncbi:alpha/beta fold hydrolase [Rhodococcus sp. NPDC056743]|uniref:alpha/beta fold hydrolase n=1 Tax=Rhodococcus sp. NPDC056743 TaxID=3345934 RepID=UPI00366A7EC4